MHPFYPVIKPYKTHEFKVDAPHVLYVEEVGNPLGIPVLILHSGPGGGGNSHLRRFLDPQVYRMIIFDQRGSGRSLPHASFENNNTESILDDINAIRDYLDIDHFVLFGGGWGSLLALLYAQRHPQQVSALLLFQIFLGRKKDIDWLYKNGANLIYPDYWEEFIATVPEEELHNIPQYYAKCLQGDNDITRMAAAKNWALWRARCSSLQPHFYLIEQYTEPRFALALATLESYYINNHFFIEENQILNNIEKIRPMPTFLVHGRYDMICPLEGAWALHQALPASVLRIIRDAGHSSLEVGIVDALIDASKELSRHHSDAS